MRDETLSSAISGGGDGGGWWVIMIVYRATISDLDLITKI